MPWTKDTTSRAPKIVYVAPADATPMKRVIYDPNAEDPWTIEYDYILSPGASRQDVENMMGV